MNLQAKPTVRSTTRISSALALAAALALGASQSAQAATYTWTNGDTTGNWNSTSTSTDWKSATVPNLAGTVIRYDLNPTANAAGTVTLNQAATIGIITQNSNPAGGNNGVFKIEKSGTNALTFDNGVVTNMWGTTAASIEFTGNGNTNNQLVVNPDIIISNTDLNIATISCGVQIGASANNSAITATTSQNLNIRANAASRALTINDSIGLSGAGTITLNNIGSSGVATTIAGDLGAKVGSITQNGANTLLLSGANSAFVGTTTITTGAIRYNAATALPASGAGRSITVNSGGIAAAGYAIDNTFLGRIVQSSAGTIALHVASGNALDFTGFASASLGATAAVTYSGALTPNAQAYRFGGGTAALTVSSNLNDSGGASSVTKTGTDTVILSGTNGYTNGTTISAGMLQFTKAAALPNYNASSKVSVGNGGTLGVNYGGASDWTSSQVDALLSTNGSGFASGSYLGFDTTNLSGSYASDITTTTLGLTKLGTNTLTLSGTNSYTGVTTITAGTLSVGSIGNGGVAGNLGQATAAASNLVFNGGTLKYTGANATSDRAFTINAGITATIDTANNLSFAGATGAATTGSLTKTGAGVLALTGVNTYGGTTTVSAGTLSIANGASFTTTVSNNTSLVVGNASGKSLLHIQSGGAGTASRLQIGTTNGGNGAVYNQGTLTVNGSANVGNFALGFATGAYGYYRHDTSTTTSANEYGIATSSNTTDGSGGNGVMDILQGKVATASGGWFSMNRANTTQYSQLNISGGTFELANSATQVGLFMTHNDTQNNKVGHAVINVSGTGSLSSAGTSTELDLMRTYLSNNPTTSATSSTNLLGVLNIGSGGTVQTNVVKATQAGGTALVNFHGGTLKANNTGVTLMGGSNIDGAYIYSGGATIDTNGKTVTISQSLQAPTGSGVSSIPVTANGTGYIGRPVVYLTGGGGTGATAVADFNPTTGEVTGITITNPGTGYTSAPTVNFSGGGGTAPTLGTITTAANTSGSLVKTGPGTLILSNASNSYSGNTVSQGVLQATVAGALGSTSGSLLINGGTLDLGNVTHQVGSASITSGTVQNGILNFGSFDIAGNSTVSIGVVGNGALNIGGSSTVALSADTFYGLTNINGGVVTLSSNMPGGLSMGAGTLNVTNTSFTVGSMNITGGTSTFAGSVAASSVSISGSSNTTFSGNVTSTGAVSISGGSVNTNGNSISGSTVTQSGGTVTGGGTVTATSSYVFDTSASNASSNANLTGSAGVTFQGGTGTTTLSGSNNYSGSTVVNSGTTFLVGASSAVSSSSAFTINGTVDLNGNAATFQSISGSGSLTSASSAVATIQSGSFAGVNGSLGLNKTSGGTLTLTGTNSYSGATNVTGGTLVVNGTTGGGAVTVGSGAVLQGSGTVGGEVTIQSGGTLAPGNSPGTETISGGLIFESGSIFTWDLDASTSDPGKGVVNSGSYDKVITPSVTGAATFNINLGTNTYAAAFWNTDKSWDNIFSSAPTLGSIFTFSGGVSELNVASRGKFTFSDSSLVWTAVPELSNILIGGLLGAGLLRRRRA